MSKQTVRDRLWLWGMQVNVLQSLPAYENLGWDKSTMTVEQAIQKTGVRNVVMGGGLPTNRESLNAMPSARRIICKTSMHKHTAPEVLAMNYGECLKILMAAKELAAEDTRIEGFLLDDFSSGTIEAGVKPEDLTRFQFANALHFPQLPLHATIYTMNLEKPQLPALLPFFAQYLITLWDADQIDTIPAALNRLSGLSGGKPATLCLYFFNFHTGKPIPRRLMQAQLDLAEKLLVEERVAGVLICGTCMMDLPWEANQCFYEWLDKVGDRVIESGPA